MKTRNSKKIIAVVAGGMLSGILVTVFIINILPKISVQIAEKMKNCMMKNMDESCFEPGGMCYEMMSKFMDKYQHKKRENLDEQ